MIAVAVRIHDGEGREHDIALGHGATHEIVVIGSALKRRQFGKSAAPMQGNDQRRRFWRSLGNEIEPVGLHLRGHFHPAAKINGQGVLGDPVKPSRSPREKAGRREPEQGAERLAQVFG